jgi:hypothetical protein
VRLNDGDDDGGVSERSRVRSLSRDKRQQMWLSPFYDNLVVFRKTQWDGCTGGDRYRLPLGEARLSLGEDTGGFARICHRPIFFI